VIMISIQVIGNDSAVTFAGSQGNFELNTIDRSSSITFFTPLAFSQTGVRSFGSSRSRGRP